MFKKHSTGSARYTILSTVDWRLKTLDTDSVAARKSGMPLEDWIAPPNYDPAVTELEKAIELAKTSGADPELQETLLRTRELVRLRDEFTLFCTSNESETCAEIYNRTHSHDWRKVFDEGKTTWNLSPVMMSGPLEGQFLKTVVSLQKAKRVLDIGMFTGYSALSLAEALPEDGEIVTIDRDVYLKKFVQDAIESSPHRNKVKILIGNALDLLEKMVEDGEKFDLFFLDADKTEYLDYFKALHLNHFFSILAVKGLGEDGEIVTIDIDVYLKKFVQGAIESSPHRNKVKILIGNALDLLEKMVEDGEKFDLFFLDADKTEYLDYFKFAFEKNLLNPGGSVLVDNSYFFGEGYSDKETTAKTFAQAVASDRSLHSVLVPIRDGIMIIRRLSDVEGGIREN
ncbi:Caffeoyl-CoA O-methyltransferase 1 [Bulinus truncatus]|nr:Caffeoyl-CoA O-methyltransferase 1 [Bulinus truncatus]